MNQIIIFLLALTIVIPVGVFFLGEKRVKRFKTMLGINIITFFGTLLVGTIVMFTTASAETATATAQAATSNTAGLAYIGAALATGLSCVGAGIAVSAAASAALGALSENEGIMGKAMIFVALAEGVAIYGLIISIMILSRV